MYTYTTVNSGLKLKKNIFNFEYEINFKYEGMLSYSIDTFYLVTSLILSTMDDIRISLIIDMDCSYLNVHAIKDIPNIKRFVQI